MPLSRCRTCSSDNASGSRFCRGEAILFSPEQLPGTAERVLVVETESVMTGLEGAASHPSLTQGEQVAPNLFLAEQIRRAAVVRGQPTHRMNVELPSSPSQPGQDHVLDHPRTLWRHGGLLSLMFRWAASSPPTRKDTPDCPSFPVARATRFSRRSRSVQP